MANAMTGKEYQQVKNRRLAVISFDRAGQRTQTYSGLTYKKAVEEIIRRQANGLVSMIVPMQTEGGENLDRAAWRLMNKIPQGKTDNLANYREEVQAHCTLWEKDRTEEANEKLHQMRKVQQDPQRGQQEVQVAPEDGIKQAGKGGEEA